MSGYTDKLAKLLDGKKPVGYQTLPVTSTAVVALTLPSVTNPEDKPYFALLTLVVDSAALNTTNACNFREDGTAPTTSVGMPLGSGGVLSLEGYKQLSDFKIIGTEADRTHSLRITYYKLGNE